MVNSDWSEYSQSLKLHLDNYTLVNGGFLGGLGNSQYIRGVAFNKFKKRKSWKGHVVVNGPLNMNHKAVFIQSVNFTDNLEGTKIRKVKKLKFQAKNFYYLYSKLA